MNFPREGIRRGGRVERRELGGRGRERGKPDDGRVFTGAGGMPGGLDIVPGQATENTQSGRAAAICDMPADAAPCQPGRIVSDLGPSPCAGRTPSMTLPRSFLLLAVLLPALACRGGSGAHWSGSHGGSTIAPPEDLDTPPRVAPALTSAAMAQHVRLSGFDPFVPGRILHPGDSVTALITASKGGRLEQWIVEMRALGPSGQESGQLDEGEAIYTTTGNRMQFKSRIGDMRLKILGPVSARDWSDAGPEDCPVKVVSTPVHVDLLRIGADGLCRVVLRFAGAGPSPAIGYSTAPFFLRGGGRGQEDRRECRGHGGGRTRLRRRRRGPGMNSSTTRRASRGSWGSLRRAWTGRRSGPCYSG